MELQRRGFLRAVPGLALGFANCTMALGQSSTGELEMASGTLHLQGKLKSGSLTLDAQDFIDCADRSVIVRGRLDSTHLCWFDFFPTDWNFWCTLYTRGIMGCQYAAGIRCGPTSLGATRATIY